jgi:hypothetical protein
MCPGYRPGPAPMREAILLRRAGAILLLTVAWSVFVYGPVADGEAGQAALMVLDEAGIGSSRTRVFRLPTRWSLKWSFACSSSLAGPGLFAVEVVQVRPSRRLDLRLPRLLRFDLEGSGVERYTTGGYRAVLRVTSQCSWTLRVAELRS